MEINTTVNECIEKGYYNLKSFIEENSIADLTTIVYGENIEFFSYEKMPFYFDGERFIDDYEYDDLPFKEYEKYDLQECKITITDSCGKGGDGGSFSNVLAFIKQVIDILNDYSASKPFSYAVDVLLIKALIKGCKELFRRFNIVEKVMNIFKFSKKNNLKMEAKHFVEDYKNLAKDEIDEINKGVEVLQELYAKGLLDEAVRIMLENEEKRYMDIYDEKMKSKKENDDIK